VASTYRRRKNGRPTGPWVAKWRDETGRWRTCVGTTDRAVTLDIAREREREARQVREGLIEPGERVRRDAAGRPLAAHIEDYRLELLARGGTVRHASHTVGVLRRVLTDAGTDSIARLAPDRIQAALGRLRAKRSARTANHARGAVVAFARWLQTAGRIREVPPGLRRLATYGEEADRRRVRRALTPDELDRLFAAAEAGPSWVARYGHTKSKLHGTEITGPDRAAVYRIAAGTGLRASEIASLTARAFDLDKLTITCRAAYTKNGREAVQPIRRDLADAIRAWLATKPPDTPIVALPARTAQMLRIDLAAAGIPYRDDAGRVADFHSIRGTYITELIRSGANPRAVQRLARHSTVVLTLERYTHLDDDDLRSALEGDPTPGP
jgi:integrase